MMSRRPCASAWWMPGWSWCWRRGRGGGAAGDRPAGGGVARGAAAVLPDAPGAAVGGGAARVRGAGAAVRRGAGGGARARLEGAAREYLAFAAERRGMYELMFRHDLLSSDGSEPDGPRLRESTGPLFGGMARLVGECTGDAERAPVVAAALWANLHGLAQLQGWGSVGLMLGEGREDALLEAVLTAHLGAR
ncbi:TetR family transcriptional regulator [Kitasatospora cheerisanensis KCTC 2395]|uniref:TetR family transcriptional regulator n=1 Tax=Kitasatospora cheerisanensis KCTC 2395 TaxID=1348663 RepID=A0A066YZE7_9ACTN|nr:TetR family transcriptional regulator [Kitasatospora cheerisanensis KCTC 2395]